VAKSTGAYSSVEGNQTVATNPTSHAEGSYCLASGLNSHAEGYSTLASGASSYAGGIYSTAPRLAQFSRASGMISQSPGEAQYCQEYMMIQTMDTDPHNLLIGGAGGSLFVLEANKSYGFRIMVLARSATGGSSKVWGCVGGIKKVNLVTSMIGGAAATVNIVSEDGLATLGWSITVDANAGNNSLDITVLDVAGATINWMASIDWVETYLSP